MRNATKTQNPFRDKVNLPLLLFFAFLALGGLLFGTALSGQNDKPAAEQGFLDCSNVDNRRPIMLRGEWEYYENVFLYPSDFKYNGTVSGNRTPQYVTVPGDAPNGYGYGTYRLTFRFVTRNKLFALKTTDIRSSARFYIDGVNIGSIGDPSTLTNGSIPWNSSQFIVFPLDTVLTSHELIIHTSNYDYYRHGVNSPMFFGPQIEVYQLSNSSRLSDTIAIVSVCLLSILLLLLLLLRIQMGNSGFLFVFSIVLALYLACSGDKLVLGLFETIFYVVYTRISLALYPLMALSMGLYLFDSPGRKNLALRLYHLYISSGVLLSVLILVLPLDALRTVLECAFLYVAIVFLSAFLYLFRRVFQRDYESLFQIYGLACWGLLFACGRLYSSGLISAASRNMLLTVSVIGFVVSQLIYVARRVSSVYSGNERLAQRMVISDKLKDELMMITSHELRTPLHGIINITESIVGRARADSGENRESLRDMELVQTLAQRMRNIVNDLYGFTGRDDEKRLDLRPVNLRVIVNAAFEMFQYITSKNRFSFRNEISADATLVLADEGKLWQIINNLIGNSVKYTKNGSITVSSRREGQTVLVSVEDTGIGMRPEDAEKIFSKSSRLPVGMEQAEGLGLGLYIARRLVERQGGSIFVGWTEPGKGTRLTFSLPACDKRKYEELTRAEKEVSSSGTPLTAPAALSSMSPANAKILVADDNQNNLMVICKIFEDCNFVIDTATSGDKALQLVRRDRYDLVVLDVMMPGITGFETCQRIRGQYSHYELPILLLTARDSSEDILTGFLAGANDYVVKPADSVELRARVFNLIALRQSVANAIDNELAFLQAQIRPHFLYNAFNTISAIALEDGESASELIDDLGVFLRKCFQSDGAGSLVSIDNELEMVQAYVRIEKARFGDRLHVRYEIDPHLRFTLPSLTIQPIVENAIRHGSMDSYREVFVTLAVYRDDKDYVVRITDNGKGIDITEVSSVLKGESEKKWAGIGLLNVNRRLKLRYDRMLELENMEGQGVCVTIRIPLEFDAP